MWRSSVEDLCFDCTSHSKPQLNVSETR